MTVGGATMRICGGQRSPLLNPFTPHSFLFSLLAPPRTPPTRRQPDAVLAAELAAAVDVEMVVKN